jgi:hypothetical protein
MAAGAETDSVHCRATALFLLRGPLPCPALLQLDELMDEATELDDDYVSGGRVLLMFVARARRRPPICCKCVDNGSNTAHGALRAECI